MTANFTSETNEKLLKQAMRMEMNGMVDIANQLCIKCLKSEAMADDGEDMLVFIYGSSIYKTINSVKDTLDAILISRCILKLYNFIRTLSPASASDASMAWATNNDYHSDSSLVEFFSWLTKTREKILIDDKDKIYQAMHAIHTKSNLKMDDTVAAMYPAAIIRAGVSKELTVSDGRLTVS